MKNIKIKLGARDENRIKLDAEHRISRQAMEMARKQQRKRFNREISRFLFSMSHFALRCD